MIREAANKRSFLGARPLGGGVRTWPLRKKSVFEALKKSGKFCVATKLEGEGVRP